MTIQDIENWIKGDNPLRAYEALQAYEGDDPSLLAWKEKIKGYVEHVFNRDTYDAYYQEIDENDVSTRDIITMDRRYPRIKYAEEVIAEKPYTTLVDVGCATGENTLYFALLDYNVTGINVITASVEKAGKKAVEMNLPATFINKNFFDVEGLWDVVLFMEILEHVPDPKAAIEKIWSLVKPGGVMIISTPKPGFWGVHGNDPIWENDGPRGHLKLYTEEELRELLAPYNLTDFSLGSDELFNMTCTKV